MMARYKPQAYVSCRLEKFEHDACNGCGEPITNENRAWAFGSARKDRHGNLLIQVLSSCKSCASMDEAIREAEDSCARVTLIGVGPVDGGRNFYNGNRCVCGAVSLAYSGHCVQCSRAHRMLDKAQSEARLMAKAIRELNSTIKGKRELVGV